MAESAEAKALDCFSRAEVEMTNRSAQIAEQRAIALATVFLTRSSDAIVTPHSGPDQGLDLHVAVLKNGAFSGWVFGVELKARVSTTKLGQRVGDRLKLSASLRSTLERRRKRIIDYPFPVLLLAFAMDTDHGYFAWLRDPQQAKLRTHTPEYLTQWRADTHKVVLSAVRAWYKSRQG